MDRWTFYATRQITLGMVVPPGSVMLMPVDAARMMDAIPLIFFSYKDAVRNS